MLGEAVRFDDASRSSLSDSPIPPGGVPKAIRTAAEECGLDPVAELYNDALRFASEGHLKPARERLHMLLAMAPEDGDALLLLAKVQVAAQRWQEALATLDTASSCGAPVPPTLRTAVEEHLRADVAADEEQRSARNAREQGEIKALRAEARRLRSENAQMLGRTSELEAETHKWAWATAGVSGLAIVFMLANLVFGGSSAPETPVVAEAGTPSVEQTEAVDNLEAAAAVQSPPSASTIADRAARALSAAPGLDDTTLEVEVQDGKAKVRGVVPTFRHKKTAERVLASVDGIQEVKLVDVTVLARTKGAVHTVAQGDSLSGIAYEYYGESSRYRSIQKANRQALGPKGNRLSIGMQLMVPPID